jgi:hypothetical protein
MLVPTRAIEKQESERPINYTLSERYREATDRINKQPTE